MKYLGLDVGKKTIGLAVGEMLATELTTLKAPRDQDFYTDPARSDVFQRIRTVLDEESASALVVGLPVKEDGTHSEESSKIADFARGLEEFLDMSVHTVDETLTSFMARDMLDSQGVGADEIEARVDQLSAQLILQQFLEEHATP